ncbi:OmpA family protein [Robiginitalea sediminis]|uniref:OmpA family protein n=1 Tax=Robiginitalea sediminis TaxID=1982593 RepID=UPI000B4B7C94|nr:OmpA family protein [Robiginitalea sediminis]
MKLQWIYLALALSASAAGNGQNLIPNPGFEEHARCPAAMGNLSEDLPGWKAPTAGSTDYFHACSTVMAVPGNFNGSQPPAEGQAYAGMYFFAPGDYREYLQVGLTEPLAPEVTYVLSFRISLAENSDYALSEVGALFSTHPVSAPTKKVLGRKYWHAAKGARAFLETIPSGGFYSDTGNWMGLTLEYKARGGERYLTVGNFKPNARTRKQRTPGGSNKGAYYYLDAFSLMDPNAPAPIKGEEKTFPIGEMQVLPGLLFHFDTADLRPEGKELLDGLYFQMQRDTALQVALYGHTDRLGSPAYNLALSEARCRSVAAYLTGKGLASRRIRWEGLGAARPVAGNDTPEGRTRNRRVEFRLYYALSREE